MTANQINYAKAKEEVRHNLQTEALTHASNEIAAYNAGVNAKNAETSRMKLDVDWANVGVNARNADTNLLNAQTKSLEQIETARANRAAEQLSYIRNVETQRANLASEALTEQRNQETQRSNIQQETLASYKYQEEQRHNEAAEQLQSSGQRAGVLSSLISAAGNLVGKLFGR